MSVLDRAAFSGQEFRMNLTVSGVAYPDYGFQTLTIPGLSDPTTTEYKLNNESRNVVTAAGTDNNFTFDTAFTNDFFAFRDAAKGLAKYTASLSGTANSAFANTVITLSGTVASPGDLQIGVDDVPTFSFNGTTEYLKVETSN